MARRKNNLSLIVVIALLAFIAWYINREEAAPGEATPRDTAPAAASAKEQLPCASYKEHRKEVTAPAEVPMLTVKNAPAYKVLKVIDGDTIVVAKNGETTVRLMAMDTPERTTTRNGAIEHFGEEAYRHALSLVEQSGWEVRLTYDQTKTDQYGRDLAYVWLKDGRMLNAAMVADGYAYSYTSSPKPEYVDQFLALMRQARTQEKGLWRVCE